MLTDPDILSIFIEDRSGGAFDDIVVRRRRAADTYIQVKTSTSGDKVVSLAWLLAVPPSGKRSPLKRMFETYADFTRRRDEVELEFWTNRSYDSKSRLLGKHLDMKSETIRIDDLDLASSRTQTSSEINELSAHLDVKRDALLAFLGRVRWKATGSELAWRDHARPLMELAGLRSDDEAVNLGMLLVRSWVTDGKGPQYTDDIREQVAANGLLAQSGTLVLAVHGIDRTSTPLRPTVECDFVELYEGCDAQSRRLFSDRKA